MVCPSSNNGILTLIHISFRQRGHIYIYIYTRILQAVHVGKIESSYLIFEVRNRSGYRFQTRTPEQIRRKNSGNMQRVFPIISDKRSRWKITLSPRRLYRITRTRRNRGGDRIDTTEQPVLRATRRKKIRGPFSRDRRSRLPMHVRNKIAPGEQWRSTKP